MSESILEASQKAKTHGVLGFFKKKSVIAVIAVLFVAVGAWAFYSPEEKKKTGEMSMQKKYTVNKGDIKIAIEADGKVVAKDGVELSFSVSGDTLEVAETFVEEGDIVKKGDKIARVEADSLELSVRSSYASYQSALASYNDKLDGASTEETIKSQNNIRQAEFSLEQAKVSLERTKANAEDSIRNAEDQVVDAKDALDYDFEEDYEEAIAKEYEDLVTSLKSIAISMDDILKDSDRIIGVDDKYLNDGFEDSLGAKDKNTLNTSSNTYRQARDSYNEFNIQVVGLSDFSSQSVVDIALEDGMSLLNKIEEHLYQMQTLLSNTITSSNLTQSSLNTFVSTINANRSNVNTKISNLNADEKSVNDAKDNLADYKDDYSDRLQDLEEAYIDAQENLVEVIAETERDILDAERSIETKDLSLSEAKLNHDELLAPLTSVELSSAKSQLTSSAVSLERANNELDEAVLISPIDGEVALLNYKAGDIILRDDNLPMVSIINNDTLFIEVNIEEADINKLEVAQKAIATFDALDELELEGEISFISLTSNTNNNGIVTYLVRVLFENTDESKVREGMSAYIDFVTAGVDDVLMIPVDAVKNVAGKPSVQAVSGEWIPVVTGFTDGDDVEVISGLKMGDIIVY